MSYQEKTVAVSLVTFTLILGFYGIRVLQMIQTGGFNSGNVFRLWGIIIALAIVATIVLTILTHILSAILHAIQTGAEKPEIEDIQDERDQFIDLRGTKVTYLVSSIGSFFAMLTFVLGQSALVMFTLLVVSGLIAQIVGDAARLYLYRRGF
jgi:hypothetical protein